MAEKKFLIVDGSSLVFRAFYALPRMTSPGGEDTNAVYGLAMMITRLISDEKPDMMVICFDKGRVTFRTDMYKEYKAQRQETPKELTGQFELAKDFLNAMGLAWEEVSGYEADDIIGTLSRAAKDCQVLIVTGDKDELQLIDNNTTLLLTKKGISDLERWDENTMRERYGLTPAQFIDYKGLRGDASDNIPGVKGVGEKTALKLLGEFGSIDELYNRIEEVTSPALKQKLLNEREMAFLSRELATINCQTPLALDWQKYQCHGADIYKLRQFYERLNFQSLLRKLPEETEKASPGLAVSNFTFTSLAPHDLAKQLLSLEGEVSALFFARDKETLALGAFSGGKAYAASFHQAVDLLPLASYLADTKLKKIVWHSKELYTFIAAAGMELNGVCDDVILAAYLLDPAAGSYTPSALASLYLPAGSFPCGGATCVEKAAAGAAVLPALIERLRTRLTELTMMDVYKKLELPLSRVLADMELAGVKVDKECLIHMDEQLALQERELTARAYELAKHEFNLNSPKQLGVILFDELGLPPIKKNKTGYSTSVEVLEQLAAAHPIIPVILQFRTVNKLRSTYAQGLQGIIAPDGRIHTTFNQTVTATGRLSSTDPNLQNIPVREEEGRKLRAAFVSDDASSVLLAADYSQIELRVLAHISGDQLLQKAFFQGDDIHTSTAAEVFGLLPEEVTSELRRRAKAVNFGIVYGISDYGLSQDLGISRREAGDYIKRYLARYTGVAEYMKNIVHFGREHGYVATLSGRRRCLPDLTNKNFNLRSFAERMALNTPIQGTAADIIKAAMLHVAERLQRERLRSRMLLQVHDELIFNVPDEEIATMKALAREEMQEAWPLNVPLVVDIKYGRSWYDMKPDKL